MAKYCLPIIEQDIATVQSRIESAKVDYTFFEIWCDYLPQTQHPELVELAQNLGPSGIFLFRRNRLEPICTPLEKRLKFYSDLPSESWIDLDFSSQRAEIEVLQNAKANIILSFHNYEFTPSDSELSLLVAQMLELKPTILKIATLCQTKSDAIRLIRLWSELVLKGQRALILGMGELGVPLRILQALKGEEWVFAPQDAQTKSAPGQLTIQQVKAIENIIKG